MFDSAIQTPFSEAPSSDQRVGALAAITCSRDPESDAPVLPAPRRVVFTLFEVDELRSTEIAAHLKISLGTVRSRLRYARELLRREVRRRRLVSARAAAAKRPYKATLPLHQSP